MDALTQLVSLDPEALVHHTHDVLGYVFDVSFASDLLAQGPVALETAREAFISAIAEQIPATH